jgi:hypothetical protein
MRKKHSSTGKNLIKGLSYFFMIYNVKFVKECNYRLKCPKMLIVIAIFFKSDEKEYYFSIYGYEHNRCYNSYCYSFCVY